MISVTATTSFSTITACCTIATAVLLFLLATTDVMSKGDPQNQRNTTALRIVCVPLVAVFIAFLVNVIAQLV
jgi:hypothetical protein